MGYKSVIVHRNDVVKLIQDIDWTTRQHINEYIEHITNFGLRPYKKDIRLSSSSSGIGDPKMNHYGIKINNDLFAEHYKFIIIDKRKWMLTRIDYGI